MSINYNKIIYIIQLKHVSTLIDIDKDIVIILYNNKFYAINFIIKNIKKYK